jgi:hypothetical protein
MKPTPKLRFIERDLGYTKIRILQQWWEHSDSFDIITAQPIGKWCDVQLEKE